MEFNSDNFKHSWIQFLKKWNSRQKDFHKKRPLKKFSSHKKLFFIQIIAQKTSLFAKLAKELGLKDKAVGLVQLDAENLEEAVKKVAEEYPELKVNYQIGGSSNPANFNNSSMPNPYKKETFNLTRQATLEANNPSQAAKFKAEAGVK